MDIVVIVFGGLYVLVNNVGIFNIGMIEDYVFIEW